MTARVGASGRTGASRGRRSAAVGDAWEVWVDTGGTFTDCLARDPAGALRRVKVLSSGALRGVAASPPAATEAGGWALHLAGIAGLTSGRLPGWRLRRVGVDEEVAALAWDAGTGVVALAGAPPADLRQGDACELVSPEESPVLACRLVTGTAGDGVLPPLRLRLATTLGTNALLERRGAPTALFVTRGFADLLEIGNQQRPDLFALAVVKPLPLHAATVEVDERMAADGEVLRPLDLMALRAPAERLLASGVRSAAVALLHSYCFPAHERSLAAALYAWGFTHVSASAELEAAQGYVARTETAVADAYLAPLLGRYLRRVSTALGGAEAPRGATHLAMAQGPAEREPKSRPADPEAPTPLLVMTSAGGLVEATRFQPREGLLSGPAAGVVGAAAAAVASGFSRVVTFDMGGTSTDVARWDGELPWVYSHQVGSARLLAPAVAVETVAAGGGSVCSFDGRDLRVGPESGGSRPGPACYGAGGPLCLTDVNLLLGRLDPSRFEIPLRVDAAERACAALEAALAASGHGSPAAGDTASPSRELLLAGLLQIADERMAEAIRQISVRQGYDPAGYALLAFGGAGAQHACAVGALLGIATVLVPVDAGLLSARGLGAARLERVASRQVLRRLAAFAHELPAALAALAAEAAAAVVAQGVPASEVDVARRLVELRYAGQESSVEVPWPDGGPSGKGWEPGPTRDEPAAVEAWLAAAFAERYRALFGYESAARPLEVVALRCAAAARGAAVAAVAAPAPREAPPPSRFRRCWLDGRWRRVGCWDRESLPPGAVVPGPALILEAHCTTVLPGRWRAEVDGAGAMVLRHLRRGEGRGRRADAVPAGDEE